MKARPVKRSIEVQREVIIQGHQACVGFDIGTTGHVWSCGYWRVHLYRDARCKETRFLRCRECRAATRGRDG
jgi:hypothetical protein